MIFDEATFDTFGYSLKTLSPKSSKFVIAVCNKCGNIRIIRRYSYHDLCLSCSHKGNISGSGNKGKIHTEATKALMSAAARGRVFSEEHKSNIAKSKKGDKNHMFGKFGDKHHNYKGGEKEKYKRFRKTEKGRTNNAKAQAKRRQGLDYTLLMPLESGEVGHHVTDEYVIGIPEEVHQKFSGYSRKKHRLLTLEWLKTHDVFKYEVALNVL